MRSIRPVVTELRNNVRLEVCSEAHFQQELEMVLRTVESLGPFLAYIHGDPCPDNVSFLGEQMRLIDFEFGRFGHALLDAIYGRMMFPTCWCANRLPGDVVTQMEAAYRAALVRGCREAQEGRVFEPTLVSTCAFWVLNTLSWRLEGVL
jgi:tRNA A-37 threonylcarbamoyl transferase component Bud32